MSMSIVEDLASQVNSLASGRPIGNLQQLRMQLHGKSRVPTRAIFDARTTHPYYAFHVGGRGEIQFNIGDDHVDGVPVVRYGLGFSLEPSQSFPDVSALFPKIRRFNDFISLYRSELAQLSMWHFIEGKRSQTHLPTEIPPELARPGVFIFMGGYAAADRANASEIVDLFDRLLPMYEFVEAEIPNFPAFGSTGVSFEFKSSAALPVSTTTRTISQRELDIQLRHGDLARALIDRLSTQIGADNVRFEVSNGPGCKIDVVARHGAGYWFYEIKTATTARGCIREALPQLMEYAYWPGVQSAERIVVVGEPALDTASGEYLNLLRSRFGIPISYERIHLPTR